MTILNLNINGCIEEGSWASYYQNFGAIEPKPPTKLVIYSTLTNGMTIATSYDVLIGGTILDLMGFVVDFGEEIASNIL